MQQLVNIAFLKWPCAIDKWSQLTSTIQATDELERAAGESLPSLNERLASAYHGAAGELAKSLDAEPLSWMHQQISRGRQTTLLGAQAWLKATGAMAPAAPPNSEPATAKRLRESNVSENLAPTPQWRRRQQRY